MITACQGLTKHCYGNICGHPQLLPVAVVVRRTVVVVGRVVAVVGRVVVVVGRVVVVVGRVVVVVGRVVVVVLRVVVGGVVGLLPASGL